MGSFYLQEGKKETCSTSRRLLGSMELYHRDIRNIPILTNEEELVLYMKWKKGDESAGRDLVRANLRLVSDIALNYSDECNLFEDLVQEGNLGLYDALNHFDPSFKTRFSSYAYFWAERYILNAISDQARVIRIPSFARDLPERWNRARQELQEEGETITDEAIARRIGYTGNFDQAMMTVRGAALERDTEKSAYQEASEIDGVRRPNENAIEREQNLLRHRYIVQLMKDVLTVQERKYVTASFGFDNNREKNGPALARKFHVVSTTITKHKKRALNKLHAVLQERLDSSEEQIPDLILEQIES